MGAAAADSTGSEEGFRWELEEEVGNCLQMSCEEMGRGQNGYIDGRRWALIGGRVGAADR
jgi:hypothetical protein